MAELVQIASKYESRTNIVYGTKKINAKSIMGMMSIGFVNGDEIEVTGDGADETAAVDELSKYIASEPA